MWKDAGWGIIVFLAALAAVSTDLYEAAAMDGAGRRRRTWHVTLPALRPVIALLPVLRVGDALSVGFEQSLLQRAAVGAGASEVLDTYVWSMGIQNGDIGYAAAVGLAEGLIGVGLVPGREQVRAPAGRAGGVQEVSLNTSLIRSLKAPARPVWEEPPSKVGLIASSRTSSGSPTPSAGRPAARPSVTCSSTTRSPRRPVD